jgi:hypothetical protein
MTVDGMHTRFKLELDKVDSLAMPNLLTEEIDDALNIAMDLFINQRAFGVNLKRETLEETQKRTDDLRNLTKNYRVAPAIPTIDNKENGVFVTLPQDYRHAIQEEAVITYTDCNNTTKTKTVKVKPITHDRYNKIKEDPFNKPYNDEVQRLPFSNNTYELLTAAGETVNTYILRYLKLPLLIDKAQIQTPLGVPGTGVIELATHTHNEIVKLAVGNTLETIESPRSQTYRLKTAEME